MSAKRLGVFFTLLGFLTVLLRMSTSLGLSLIKFLRLCSGGTTPRKVRLKSLISIGGFVANVQVMISPVQLWHCDCDTMLSLKTRRSSFYSRRTLADNLNLKISHLGA